jgi:hypothetical protein
VGKKRRCSFYLKALPLTACVLLTASTVSDAAAPPSQRTRIVDGVPLIPLTRSQRAECQRYANEARRPVMCPGVLLMPIPVSDTSPQAQCLAVSIGEDACGPAGYQIDSKELLINQSNFQVPTTYVGVPMLASVTGGPLGHFVFLEGPRVTFIEGSGPRPKQVSVPSTCKVVPLGKALRIHGSVATFYQCANGPLTYNEPALYLGHDLLTWRERGLEIQVSFHGHSRVNLDLDTAVANSTVVVSTKSR